MDKEITEREAFEAWWYENWNKKFKHKESAIELWKAAYKAGAAVGSDELHQTIMADMLRDGWRQCAKGQHTSQFCGQLEAAVAAERAVSDKLLEALKKLIADCMARDFNEHWPAFFGAEDTIAEVEAMRKENGE